MTFLKMFNLALRFFLELCLLAALAYSGFRTGGAFLIQITLAILFPLLAAIIWGKYIAPRASTKLPDWLWLSIQLLLFASAVVGLSIAGKPLLAVVFAAAVAINILLIVVWRQRDSVNETTAAWQSGE